jgi:ubiquinone/menaquinone biosynthesis C-methylase UbiE
LTTDTSQFKEAVRDQWTHAADAWSTWHPKFSEMSRDVTQLICEAAQLRPGLSVLDLAGGTGEPGLTAATLVAPDGIVTCTDFVPGMVATAEANAKKAGLTNMKFQQVDAEDIPFGDATFDRVISRFGVMFMPQTQRALGEMRRVLKPGGRAAFTVWQTVPQNPWFGDINKLLLERGITQPPPPGMPSPFRFGESGSLPRELSEAGFKDVQEKPHKIDWAWPGSPDEYLGFVQETFPAWRRGLEAADESTRAGVTAQMRKIVEGYYDGKKINFAGNIYVVTAVA